MGSRFQCRESREPPPFAQFLPFSILLNLCAKAEYDKD